MTRDRDRYRVLTAIAVLLVAAIAAVVSYLHIASLALGYGQSRLAAYLLPISIDGVVATSSLVMMRAARAGVSAPWLARTGLVLSIAATLAANVASGLGHGWHGALVASWPPIGFVVSAETAISMSRHRMVPPRRGKPAATAAPSAGKPATRARKQSPSAADVEAAALDVLARQPDITGADLGRAVGVTPRTGQRMLSRLADRAAMNGGGS